MGKKDEQLGMEFANANWMEERVLTRFPVTHLASRKATFALIVAFLLVALPISEGKT